jgi:hypothetical protein
LTGRAEGGMNREGDVKEGETGCREQIRPSLFWRGGVDMGGWK